MTYYAQRRGDMAHAHSYRAISITLEGPLKVLFCCRSCGSTETVKKSTKRKVLPGVPDEFWGRLGSIDSQEAEGFLRTDLIRELERRLTAAGVPRGALAD
jgi:hypothetical protein